MKINLVYHHRLSGECQKIFVEKFQNMKLNFFIIKLLVCFKQANAQTLNEFVSNPGLFSYNALNFATGGLTEALTGGRQYFNYNQRDRQTSKRPSIAQTIQNIYGRNNYNSGSNYQQQSNAQQTSSSCSKYFSFFRENNEIFGTVVLQNPDRVRNVLKLELSLGARLSSVSFICLKLIF